MNGSREWILRGREEGSRGRKGELWGWGELEWRIGGGGRVSLVKAGGNSWGGGRGRGGGEESGVEWEQLWGERRKRFGTGEGLLWERVELWGGGGKKTFGWEWGKELRGRMELGARIGSYTEGREVRGRANRGDSMLVRSGTRA